MILDERKSKLLLYLMNSDTPVSISKMAKLLNVSNRTIRYDLDAIDTYLKSLGYPILQRKQNCGVYYKCSESDYKGLIMGLKRYNQYQYKLSKKEREKVIISLLFQQKGFTTISNIAEHLYFSRSTIAKDLREVEYWLNKRNLVLVSLPNKGIKIDGEESLIRRAAIELLTEEMEIDNIFEMLETRYPYDIKADMSGLLEPYFEDIDIGYLIRFIENIQKQLEMVFSYDSYTNLLIHIALSIKRIKMNKGIKMSRIELMYLKSTEVFIVVSRVIKQLEERFMISIPMDEIGYVTIHILGSSITRHTNGNMNKLELENFATSVLVANSMILEVSKLSKIDFTEDNILLEGLIQHIGPAIYRTNHNLIYNNPYNNEIKENYKELFGNVKKCLKNVNLGIGEITNDDEISFITMHFAASIERRKRFKSNRKSNLLIVCGNGLGTGMLIKSKIESLYNVNIVNVIGYHQLEESIGDKSIDLIVSTKAISGIDIPYVRISPMFIQKDLDELNKYLKLKYDNGGSLSEILEIIRRNCIVKDYESLKFELSDLVKNNTTIVNKENLNPMLRDLLNEETIKLNVDAKDWEEAVRIGGSLLEKVGAVDTKYTEKMIEGIKEIGPYIVIAPGIAMPHARPGAAVNEVGMSFITLKNPVNFGNKNNDPVKIVVCLCAVNNTSHIEALSEMATLLGNKDFVNDVTSSNDINDVMKYIKR